MLLLELESLWSIMSMIKINELIFYFSKKSQKKCLLVLCFFVFPRDAAEILPKSCVARLYLPYTVKSYKWGGSENANNQGLKMA